MNWEKFQKAITKLSPTFVIKNPFLCYKMSLLLKSQKISEKLTDLTCKVVTIYSCQLYLLTTLFWDFDFLTKLSFFFGCLISTAVSDLYFCLLGAEI